MKVRITAFSTVARLLLAAGVLLAAGCGGGGGGSGGDTDACAAGWGLLIENPSVAADYSVSLPSVELSGIAPLTNAWDACYPCVPSTTGVDVSWSNQATGTTGTAVSWVRTGWFFGWPIYSHHWYAVIGLQPGANLLMVTATENGTRVGQDCVRMSYVPDTAAPAIPASLQATALSTSRIALSWDAVTDDATTDDAGVGYRLFRDGNDLRTLTMTSTDDSGLAPGTEYCYTIAAFDTAGNTSPQSPAVCTTTFDSAAPTVPTRLHSIVLPGGDIALSWTASTDDVGVTGYRILRNGVEIGSVPQPGYTDSGTGPDTRYCYRVLAYDQSGNESQAGNESCNDTRWKTTTVDDSAFDLGSFSDIVAGPSGSLHIAYYNSTGKDLRYAVNTAGSWTTETVAASGIIGEYPSLVLDSNGAVHITCYEYGEFNWPVDELKHITNASGTWTIETVAAGGWFNALAIDTQDHLHAGYRNNGLRHAGNASGNWQDEAVAAPDVWISIATDAADHVHLSTYQGYPANDLLYLTNASGVWVAEPVDTGFAGEFNSLAMDAGGHAHISYCEYFGGLRYATNASGNWVTEPVDESGCRYSSLALDAGGHAHISYVSDGYLMYASNATGNWLLDSIDTAQPTDSYYAYATALAVDGSGDVHISYYAPGRKLGYATTR